MNNGLRRYGIWVVVALVGAVCWGMLALARGETINAGWMLFAALASYAIAFRFYARFIRDRVLGADDSRATPAERLNNGRDFEPMDRRVLWGSPKFAHRKEEPPPSPSPPTPLPPGEKGADLVSPPASAAP